MPGIFAAFDSVGKVLKDSLLNRPVQLFELTLGDVADFNSPAQVPA
jgi:hypothetical protein